MIIVTNRNLQEQESPDKKFGENFNENGPTELRVAEANKIDGQWQVEIFPDQLSYQGTEMPASEVIFLREQEQMKVKKQNCLFYIDLTDQVGTSHSYFNDQSIQQAPIRKVFDNMFNGLRAERHLVFNSSLGVYQVS